MPGAIHEVSLAILRACRDKGPQDAFYPRIDAPQLPIQRDHLDATLDSLRLAGFLEIAEWVAGKGQGYRLTDAGRQALDRPALLDRPVAKPMLEEVSGPQTEWERGEAIREAVFTPQPRLAAPALIAINVLVFVGMCIYIAAHDEPFMNYVSGAQSYNLPGLLWGPAVFFGGQWWRLVTFMFLHANLVHLGLNMLSLWSLSRSVESRMGIFRYLLLYFGCGVISGVAVLLQDPNVRAVGASGAICGVFSALGVSIYMNRRHLPPQHLQAATRSFTQNILLIVLISMPGLGLNVSWSGHLGGAIGGILMTPPLEWMSRRSPLWHRVLGVLMLLAIAAVCFVLLENSPMARLAAQQRAAEL